MNNWKIAPKTLAVLIGIAMGLTLLPSLSGCTAGNSPLRYVLDALSDDNLALDQQGRDELARFATVYREFAADPRDDDRLEHFRDAFKRVRVSYVRDVADGKLIDAAIAGVRGLEEAPGSVPAPRLVETALDSMMAALDPHSSYLNPEEYAQTQVTTRGEFGGLGIEVTLDDGLIKVVSPIEDTPAFRAGLKPQDLITHLDGEAIKGMQLMDAVRRMRGQPGSDIRLTIQRKGVAPFDVTIIRAIIKIRSVRWHSEGDIAYIRVSSFTEKVEHGIARAMSALRAEMGPRLTAVVLDLRNNPGGLLDQSLFLADAFLESGKIVSVGGRKVSSRRTFTAHAGDLANGVPMVVLTNGGSASASEIVASALQDHQRAIVMGRRTFGKGSVQTITPLPLEGALRLTTALYYAPSGRAIQAVGVEPDITLLADKVPEGRHEVDLPGALPAVNDAQTRDHPALKESACPAVGEKEDRMLGCALALLRAGSAEKFLASVGRLQAM